MSRLWRYNYAILMGSGYWVIVLPVAASQIMTLWMMAVAGEFRQAQAAQIAELMAPILGAFLVAHCLAPEYRSGVGAVLACKPFSLHRVVTMRVGVAMAIPALLTLVTLLICYLGLRQVNIWTPMLAALPSLWFLSAVALTFATLFRNALAGFAVAAGLWALDLSVGYGVHPYLSLQGLHARMESDLLSGLWLPNKIVLIAVGALLLWLHGRLLFRICRPIETGNVVRVAATTAAILCLYCATGAATMVAYAHAHRANLPYPDVTWLRRQLRVYGPVPVARLFGPAFAVYVQETTSGQGESSTLAFRVQQLEQALQRWPGSMWADGIAYALAREREHLDIPASARDYRSVVDRFPDSPFAPRALVGILRLDPERLTQEDRLRAARRLIAEYPRSRETGNAADALLEYYPQVVAAPEMLSAALTAAEGPNRPESPQWLVVAAQVQVNQGRPREARAAAQRAIDTGEALLAEERNQRGGETGLGPQVPRIQRAISMARDILRSLSGSAE